MCVAKSVYTIYVYARRGGEREREREREGEREREREREGEREREREREGGVEREVHVGVLGCGVNLEHLLFVFRNEEV